MDEQAKNFKVPILHEDNHLLVVQKPPGMLSQADRSGDPDLLTHFRADLKRRYDKPGKVYLGLVHRLDRPVGGVMVLAKTSKAATRLSEQVRNRRLQKEYLAIVAGRKVPEQGRLVDDLVKDPKTNRSRVVPAGQGKNAALAYRRLGESPSEDWSLLWIRLESGRAHQIRVQLAHWGHPIVGDYRYGPANAKPGRPLALFASRLGLQHPTLKTSLSFTAQPPQTGPWTHFAAILGELDP